MVGTDRRSWQTVVIFLEMVGFGITIFTVPRAVGKHWVEGNLIGQRRTLAPGCRWGNGWRAEVLLYQIGDLPVSLVPDGGRHQKYR